MVSQVPLFSSFDVYLGQNVCYFRTLLDCLSFGERLGRV